VLWKGGDFSSIGAFYLAGQGAVFTIPASGLRDALRVRKEFNIKNAFNLTPGAFEFSFDEQAIEDLTQEHLEEIMNDGLPTPPVPPVPPPASVAVAPSQASPAPAAPPQAGVAQNDASPNPSEKQEQMRRKLSELQAKEKRKAVEEEARRAKFREVLTQLKGFLIEALANHGDSMTVVKPNEYLNLVVTDDGRSFWVGGDSTNDRAQREIISVQKSVISDYKAGRLTLDGFKQKVMNYMN
jgi:hypothetical protein